MLPPSNRKESWCEMAGSILFCKHSCPKEKLLVLFSSPPMVCTKLSDAWKICWARIFSIQTRKAKFFWRPGSAWTTTSSTGHEGPDLKEEAAEQMAIDTSWLFWFAEIGELHVIHLLMEAQVWWGHVVSPPAKWGASSLLPACRDCPHHRPGSHSGLIWACGPKPYSSEFHVTSAGPGQAEQIWAQMHARENVTTPARKNAR